MASGEYSRNSQKDTSTGTKGTKKVRSDRQSTNASTTKGSSSGNDPLQLLVHGLLTVTSHDETLLLQLLGDITGGRTRNLDPRLGEDGAGAEHEDDIDGSVDGVQESVGEVEGRRHVVRETRGGIELRGTLLGLPDTQKLNEEVLGKAAVQHLRDEENVGAEGRLKHNGHVASVEQADGVSAYRKLAISSPFPAFLDSYLWCHAGG